MGALPGMESPMAARWKGGDVECLLRPSRSRPPEAMVEPWRNWSIDTPSRPIGNAAQKRPSVGLVAKNTGGLAVKK